MTDAQNDFTTWLHQQAATAGYDPDVRGTVSKLAEAAGLDIGSTSRVLRGRTTPTPDTLRSLAQPLKVTVVELFFRAGLLRAEDIAEAIAPDPTVDYSQYHAPTAGELTVEEAAASWGITPEDLPILTSIVDELQKRSRRRVDTGE